MYLDVDIAVQKGIIGRVKVYLNGEIIKNATRAEEGENGFVEHYDDIPKLDVNKVELITHLKRGNVRMVVRL